MWREPSLRNCWTPDRAEVTLVRNPHEHCRSVYTLGECTSYRFAPTMSVISAQAGIHCYGISATQARSHQPDSVLPVPRGRRFPFYANPTASRGTGPGRVGSRGFILALRGVSAAVRSAPALRRLRLGLQPRNLPLPGRRLLDDLYLVIGKPVKLVDEPVYLPVGR